MANLARSAASGSEWTFHHLASYNVHIETVGTEHFFGFPELPAAMVHQMILDNLHLPFADDQPFGVQVFFRYLSVLAPPHLNHPVATSEAEVNDFASQLLSSVLHFQDGNRYVGQERHTTQFFMGGQKVQARPDLYVKNPENNVVFVQENKVSVELLFLSAIS